MKTKNIIAVLLALPIMACYTGCKSEDELTAKPAKEALRVLDGVINIQSDVENTNVNVTADCHWKVDSLDTGDFGKNLNVQPREGIGDGILQVTTDQNTTNTDRTAKFILVSDGGLRQKITITQNGKGDGINLSKGSFNFETNPTEAQSLTITSNTSWKIEEANGAKWVHFEPESGGSGTTSVQIKVDASSTDATRSTFRRQVSRTLHCRRTAQQAASSHLVARISSTSRVTPSGMHSSHLRLAGCASIRASILSPQMEVHLVLVAAISIWFAMRTPLLAIAALLWLSWLVPKVPSRW